MKFRRNGKGQYLSTNGRFEVAADDLGSWTLHDKRTSKEYDARNKGDAAKLADQLAAQDVDDARRCSVRAPNKRWIEGKRIRRVHWRPFSDGRGGTAHNPIFILDDGSQLTFAVEETDGDDYGVVACYTKERNA